MLPCETEDCSNRIFDRRRAERNSGICPSFYATEHSLDTGLSSVMRQFVCPIRIMFCSAWVLLHFAYYSAQSCAVVWVEWPINGDPILWSDSSCVHADV